MPAKLIRHGSNAGYRTELAKGDTPCERCSKGHLVYNRQYTKTGKAKGLKFPNDMVVDHLYTGTYTPGKSSVFGARLGTRGESAPVPAPSAPPDEIDAALAGTEPADGDEHATPSLADRLTAGLGKLVMPDSNSDYVDSDEPPEYLYGVEPDPEPADGEWSEVTGDEFVLNAKAMAKIEENLGTYLSVVGMTVEMVDPYCGPILAENFDNIVNRWSKVVAHYPAAATLFLDGKGGVIFSWIGALQATWPFLLALYDHHLAHNVKVQDGRVYRQNMNGQGPVVNSTMPPMADFNYTAS
jgi:hypothetical protein